MTRLSLSPSAALQLSENLRHLRVFEMDTEDEDDEPQNDTAEQDTLDATMTSQGDESAEAGNDEAGKTEEHLELEETSEL